MKQNMNHPKSRLPRLLASAVAVGTMIAWFAVGPPAQSQGIPPLCAGAGEPGTNPCGTIGVSCSVKSDCGGTPGAVWWYCCVDIPDLHDGDYCLSYQGKWKCCNNVWKKRCESTNDPHENYTCQTDGTCLS